MSIDTTFNWGVFFGLFAGAACSSLIGAHWLLFVPIIFGSGILLGAISVSVQNRLNYFTQTLWEELNNNDDI